MGSPRTRPEPEPAALKTNDAARFLGISRRTLINITNDGQIPVCRLSPRLNVYTVSDLSEYLDKRKVVSA